MARPEHSGFDVRSSRVGFVVLVLVNVVLWVTYSSVDYGLHWKLLTVRDILFDSVVGPDDLPWSPRGDVERKHVFFLNVHMTGGEVVQNILLRFAQSRNLTVLLPWKTPGVFSQTSRDYWNNTDPRAFETGRSNDILCHHLVFNDKFGSKLMPQDTLYVGILLSPFQRFILTFKHYLFKDPQPYLLNITGLYPEATYLADPKRWEPDDPSRSFTNNRMAFDFGLEPEYWKNKRAIKKYLDFLERRFDLVMLGDKLDESLVLLKRMAGWKSLQDILYLQPLTWQVGETYVFNETQRDKFRRAQGADYDLYRRFDTVLSKRIAEEMESDYGFTEEVSQLKSITDTARLFCEHSLSPQGNATNTKKINKSAWNDQFYITHKDCQKMSGLVPLVDWDKLELVRD